MMLFWNYASGQDFLLKEKTINGILKVGLPDSLTTSNISYVKTLSGYANDNYYQFNYYDTIIAKPTSKEFFQIALNGFFVGVLESARNKYTMKFSDTSIGGTNGKMAHLIPNDTTEAYKHIYLYATIANRQFYLFEVFSPYNKPKQEDINTFFSSIYFESNKIEETSLF
jgi:hypothetical protein